MALPSVVTPEYKCTIPSTGQEIEYRPFLVKEEKLLLMAGESDKDEAHAAKTVRTLLKEIIKNEKESRPLSDEQISNIFKDKGVNVARRTVAKYREMLKIPSSAERKRLMRLNKVINIK